MMLMPTRGFKESGWLMAGRHEVSSWAGWTTAGQRSLPICSLRLIVKTKDVIVYRRRGAKLGADTRRLRTPARVLTVLEKPLLAEVVRLALTHGQFLVR